jgi:hypothetical protein
MCSESGNITSSFRPKVLYHASENVDIKEFEPRMRYVRDPDEGPQIFATPYKALASEFLVPTNERWANGGSFNSIQYFVISDKTLFENIDKGGAIYTLPPETFETNSTKGLGSSEWTSSIAVRPSGKEVFKSGLKAMLELGVQVYFVDPHTYELIESSRDHGFSILAGIESENQKTGINNKSFELL